MINIVYSYLQCRKPDEDWIYETLYYLDKLIEKAKKINSAIGEQRYNGVDYKGKRRDESVFKLLSVEDKKELLEVLYIFFILFFI